MISSDEDLNELLEELKYFAKEFPDLTIDEIIEVLEALNTTDTL